MYRAAFVGAFAEHMEHGLCPEWMFSLVLVCNLLPPPPHPQMDLSTARADSAALSSQLLDTEAAFTSQRVRTQSAVPGACSSCAVQVASPPTPRILDCVR